MPNITKKTYSKSMMMKISRQTEYKILKTLKIICLVYVILFGIYVSYKKFSTIIIDREHKEINRR